jgi:hypothetical protein
MILSANQPYFAAFPGFFYKAHLSDRFVILDDVQFPHGATWITRNRFKGHQGTLWMTIPVWRKGHSLQKIRDVRICHEGLWAYKHVHSFMTAYKRAPFFADHADFIEAIFSAQYEYLLDFNLEMLKYLLRELGLETDPILQSELGIVSKGSQLLVDLYTECSADCLLIQKAAQAHVDVTFLENAGINVEFFRYKSPVYPQLWGSFVPNLSAFDLLFNCGPKAHDILVQEPE